MSHLRRAIAATVPALFLVGAFAPSASAKPVTPGEEALTSYDGSATLLQKGRVPGRPGNWHSVGFGTDNDDDGFVGGITDWTCPAGVQPPPVDSAPTTCTLERTSEFGYGLLGTFNHHTETATIRGTVSETYQQNGEWVEVPLEVRVTVTGVGAPTLDYDATGTLIGERWTTVKVRGRIGTIPLNCRAQTVYGVISTY